VLGWRRRHVDLLCAVAPAIERLLYQVRLDLRSNAERAFARHGVA
jgi:hypothetical protein